MNQRPERKIRSNYRETPQENKLHATRNESSANRMPPTWQSQASGALYFRR